MAKLRQGKFVKKVKKKIPWIENLIVDESSAGELNPELITFKTRSASLCALCKGTKLLCGKPKCPILEKYYAFMKIAKNIDTTNLFGDSPPSIFVGRIGYPYVQVGPMVPPVLGNTSIFELPEAWFGKPLEEILDYRLKLIRGMFPANVKKVSQLEKNRVFQQTQELAMGDSPVDSEMILKKKPKHNLLIDSYVQPMGPSAPIEKIDAGNVKIPKPVQKVYDDYDLRAYEGILTLYQKEIPVTRIQRILSAGTMGVKFERKLVPTRWSITAVDSIISKTLRENVKKYPLISNYLVFETSYLENKFVILMMPKSWSYELIEAWFPGSTWNPTGRSIGMVGDWEGYHGRKTYASIGGCYYAARLAVTEYLSKIRRQASIVIFRETYPSNLMPLGVWFVRECVRAALKNQPMKFNSLDEALRYVSSGLKIPLRNWLEVSGVLSEIRKQRQLTEFI
ncbi:MAG: Nre family DNA repair protein [Candidatus Asgardarchaeia archaeon]